LAADAVLDEQVGQQCPRAWNACKQYDAGLLGPSWWLPWSCCCQCQPSGNTLQ